MVENPCAGQTWTLGDPELAQILRRMVIRLCPSWLGPELREDACQEALCRLVQLGASETGEERSFNSSFLFATALNVKRELVRKLDRQRQREVPIELERGDATSPRPALELDGSPPDQDQRMVRRELARALRDCLARLKPERRVAVVLALAGFSIAETADRLQWTSRSVENRVSRARKQLQKCLVLKGVSP